MPSGLPVVQHRDNPGRVLAAAHNVGSEGQTTSPHAPAAITVQPGEPIQAAVDRASTRRYGADPRHLP
ncbi:MAG: hypothetical protein R2844_04775 [Caldilineales bacterium]